MSSDNHFDVIIIGTGAGGGTLAHRLALTGKRILLLVGTIRFGNDPKTSALDAN